MGINGPNGNSDTTFGVKPKENPNTPLSDVPSDNRISELLSRIFRESGTPSNNPETPPEQQENLAKIIEEKFESISSRINKLNDRSLLRIYKGNWCIFLDNLSWNNNIVDNNSGQNSISECIIYFKSHTVSNDSNDPNLFNTNNVHLLLERQFDEHNKGQEKFGIIVKSVWLELSIFVIN